MVFGEDTLGAPPGKFHKNIAIVNAKDDPFFAWGGRFLYGSLGFESIKGFFDPAKSRLELGLHFGIKGINFEVDLFGRGWFGWWRRAKVFRNITQPLSAPRERLLVAIGSWSATLGTTRSTTTRAAIGPSAILGFPRVGMWPWGQSLGVMIDLGRGHTAGLTHLNPWTGVATRALIGAQFIQKGVGRSRGIA